MTAARTLSEFAVGLRYEDLPAAVVDRAKTAIADGIAAAIQGSGQPWGRMVAEHARRYGGGGKSRLLGTGGAPVSAQLAALANGTAAHGFELDSLTQPSSGVHPGATIVPAVLALADEAGADGRSVITAVVAGAEAGIRIGRSLGHSVEKRGFHAPGITGPLAGAIAGSRLLGFDRDRMVRALGIAGSLTGGLLAFTHAQGGGMVKRLHLGRAAESGVLATLLAASGYEGPESVLEGKGGVLGAFSDDAHRERLAAKLGEKWETLDITIKRYPAHITAHASVQAIEDLRREHGFSGADVATVALAVSERVLDRHAIHEPADVMQAQYSTPFCSAIALCRDARDPASFDDASIADPLVRDLAKRITLTPNPDAGAAGWATRVTVGLRDGRTFERTATDFRGAASNPMSREDRRGKFLLLTRSLGEGRAAALFDAVDALETVADIRTLAFA